MEPARAVSPLLRDFSEGRHDAACPGENTLEALIRSRVTFEEAQPVLAHLDGCSVCRGLVAELARDRGSCETTDPSVDAGDGGLIQSGSFAGRYVLLQRVGQGGMGVVYSAYDPELDRKVALKLVRVDAPRPSAAHLAREAHALARVSHPNVVAVYDVGYHGEQVYLVMEFVAGVTLRRWLQERPRSAGEVLAVLRAAGEGVAAAHRAHLVHRDVKPENIMIDDEGRAKVTDFGLARVAAAGEGQAGQSRELAGTLRYMSPEQLRGEPVDERSDLFSFAVTAAEALTGTQPFRRDAARAACGHRARTAVLSMEGGRHGPTCSVDGLDTGAPGRACATLSVHRRTARGVGPPPADGLGGGGWSVRCGRAALHDGPCLRTTPSNGAHGVPRSGA